MFIDSISLHDTVALGDDLEELSKTFSMEDPSNLSCSDYQEKNPNNHFKIGQTDLDMANSVNSKLLEIEDKEAIQNPMQYSIGFSSTNCPQQTDIGNTVNNEKHFDTQTLREEEDSNNKFLKQNSVIPLPIQSSDENSTGMDDFQYINTNVSFPSLVLTCLVFIE